MRPLLQDLRYGLRMMVKNPGFTIVAVLTLALGIGANTAIFSVVDSLLLRPLPFKDPDRVVLVWGSRPLESMDLLPVSWQRFSDWEEQASSFDSLSAFFSYDNNGFNLTGSGDPERIHAAYSTSDLFPTLGVAPELGRAFSRDEDRPGGEKVVLLSHRLWASRFGGDPGLIGKTLVLDGQAHTVVGVMPPQFAFPRFPQDPDVWLPLSLDPRGGRRFSRGTNYLVVLGRLKPGVSASQAQTEMDGVARRLADAYPRFDAGLSVRVTPMAEQASGPMKRALLILLGAVGFVLLIACANVANLLLSRAKVREREVAIRMALGASRARLVRQWLTESALLAVAGGGVGLLLALWGIDLLSFIPYNAPSFVTPYVVSSDQISLNAHVLGFALLLSLGTGALFGLAPALRATRPDLNASLKEGPGAAAIGALRRRTGSLLVVSEIALSLVLLIGAGLMIRSFVRLSRIFPGFRPENVVTARLSLPASKYAENPRVAAFYTGLLERLRSLPEIRAAGAAEVLPLGGADETTGFILEAPSAAISGRKLQTHPRPISDGYLETMGIPLRAGRAFSSGDDDGAPKVAIVNETMARRFWPGESPIGRRLAIDYEAMRFFPDRPPQPDLAHGLREIVGVVADVRHAGLADEPAPEMYVPIAQHPLRVVSLVLRTEADEAGAAALLRDVVRTIDRDQPVSEVRSMSRILGGSVAKPRFNFVLMGLFAAVAFVLAAIGVFGVISYSVSQRTREIGVRMALGARGGDVLRMILGEGLRVTAAGVAIGLLASLALTRVLSSLLYGVSATDAPTFAVVAILLAAASLLAAYVPARRAMKVDPIVALRCE